jgi:hypothetical protein
MAACSPVVQRLESPTFQLEPDQIARLTLRPAFCAGFGNLRATLLFSDERGNTLARKEVALRCGDSAQLDIPGEKAAKRLLRGQVDLGAPKAVQPVAALEVITLGGPGRESGVKYSLLAPRESP